MASNLTNLSNYVIETSCGEEICFSVVGYALLYFLESSFCRLLIGLIWSSLVLFGVFGNGLVIFVALYYKKLNDITSCYIFNLAITDLLFVIFCIPFTTYLYLYDSWFFGIVFCKINHFMSHASVQSTCMTLTAMTIHRCNLIIKNKTQSQYSTNIKKRQRTVLLITIFIWFVSFLISSPDLIYYTVTEQVFENETLKTCSFDKDTYLIFRFYISISNFVSIATTYLIPLLIIILSYARLLSHLSKNQARLAKFNNNNKKKLDNGSNNIKLVQQSSVKQMANEKNSIADYQSLNKRKSKVGKKKAENRRKKVTKMVAVVTLNFGICWLPTHLFIILRRVLSEHQNLYPYLSLFKLIAHTLSYLTPVINPCLYAFYNENFRLSIQDLWSKVTCKSNQNLKTSRSNSKSYVVN